MGNTLVLTEVFINNVDVSSYLVTWKVDKVYSNEIGETKIVLSKSVEDILELDVTMNVKVKRGTVSSSTYFIFEGEIESFEQTGNAYKIGCFGMLYNAVRKEITYSFDKDIDSEGGQGSAIFKTLVNTYTDLVCDDTSVQATGTGETDVLTKFVCRSEDVFDKMKEIAKLYGYQFYHKPSSGLIYFEPEGFTNASTDLIVGENVVNRPVWKKDMKQLCNFVTIKGATQDVETTGSGQLGVTTGWTAGSGGYGTLLFKPSSVKVYADASNPPTTLRVGGVEGGTGNYDYSVDFENKKLVWSDKNGYVWTTNHYVKVDYSYSVKAPFSTGDAPSITAYKEFKRTFEPKQVKTIEDAKLYADNIISRYKTPFLSATLKVVNVWDLEPGQLVRVVDERNGVDDTFLITSISMSYPYQYDEVSVGNMEYKTADFEVDVARKIKELESQIGGGEANILYTAINLSRDVEHERRYIEVQKRDLSSLPTTVFILGDPVLGKLGTQKMGDSVLTYSTVALWQGNNTYKELFYDTNFKG